MTNSSYKWTVMVALLMSIVFGFGTVGIIGPLSTEIDADIGLSIAQIGAAFAFFTLASPIFSPIAGILADKYGCRPVMGIAGLIVAAASISRYFVSTGNELVALMFIAGAGFACFGPIVPKALSYVFPDKEFARANGIVTTAYSGGMTVAFLLASSVLSPALGGWRMTAVAYGLMSGVMAVFWILLFRDIPRSGSAAEAHPHEAPPPGLFGQMLRKPEILALAFYYAFCVAGLFTILSFLPRMLEDRGLSHPGMLAAVMTASTVVFNVVGGIVSDRVGRKLVLVAGAIVFALCIPALLVLSGWPLIVVLVVAGAGMGPLIPVATALPVQMADVGPTRAGTALGVIFMIGNFGGFLGPLLAGKVIEFAGSISGGFFWAAALFLLAPLAVIRLKEPRGMA